MAESDKSASKRSSVRAGRERPVSPLASLAAPSPDYFFRIPAHGALSDLAFKPQTAGEFAGRLIDLLPEGQF